jgi:2-polyprenyl-3-methyl-5-hydroxy-6-metoxy-1,4-benzoquinol methylase
VPRLIDRLAAVLAAPMRAAAFIVRGGRQLTDLQQAVQSTKKTTSDVASSVRRIDERLDKHGDRLSAIKRELDGLRGELSDRLLRINLQLGAMTRVVQQVHAPVDGQDGHATTGRRLSGRVIPVAVESEEARWAPVTGGEMHPDPAGQEWLLVDRCPFCGQRERTVVVEWNKLIMLAKAPDQESATYDYSCCHSCGVVYATRRPVGQRFLFLLQHFGEVTGKAAADGIIPNPMLNPYPLSDADKERLREMASRGVWISDHLGLKNDEYVEGALRDRFANSVHVDVIGSLVQPTNKRVLEIRPRAGTIAESLRRLYRADVSVMPMWESQKLLLKELYGFDAKGLIDYDHFEIPFDGRFDLIVCNHILVHAVRPSEFLHELRAHLNPGGYVYFYNEPEDREVLEKSQSIIAHLNPLHMQTFDQAAMIRALAANGFDVAFIKSRDCSFMVLARAAEGTAAWTPIPADALQRRIAAYQLARDRAILKLPADMRSRLGSHWTAAIEHGLAAGAVAFDDQGQLRFSAD